MGYELDKVGKYLQDLMKDYGETYFNELHKKESDEEYDEEELLKSKYSMICLEKLSRDLGYPSEFDRLHVIQDMLIWNNRKGFSTEFIFLDGSKIIVTPDTLANFEDGYLVLFNQEDYEADPTLVPNKDSLFNLVNIKEVHTIRESDEED